jgi:hypothetical protein
MRAFRHVPGLVIYAIALLTGCSSQVDSDYRGESLGTLRGTLQGDPGLSALEETAIAVVWELKAPDAFEKGLMYGEFISVSGSFPVGFRLNIIQPPAPELLRELADGNSLVVGRIYWVPLDAFMPQAGGGNTTARLGSAPDQVLVYVRDDVAESSATSRFLHGMPRAGYHVFDVERPEPILPCETSVLHDQQGYPQVTSSCVRNALRLAPDDLDSNVIVKANNATDLLYEDLEPPR